MSRKNQVAVAEQVTTFEHALEIFSYHIGEIQRAPEKVCLGFYVVPPVQYKFVRDASTEDRNWDQAYVEGRCIGNRVAARNDYVRRCASVLAAFAAAEKKS